MDIPADVGSGLGIFENLHSFENGDMFACHLKRASDLYYGTAFRAFLRELADSKKQGESIKKIRNLNQSFYDSLSLNCANGQVKRVARRFALLAAAGELAIELGVLPWDIGEANKGIRTCFEAWLLQRGGTEALEDTMILRQVRLFFEQHAESRFSWMDKNEKEDRPTFQRAGFKKTGATGTEFLVLTEVFRVEICKGLKYTKAAKLLIDGGYLIPGEEGRLEANQRLPGIKGTTRCYYFTSKILEGIEAERKTSPAEEVVKSLGNIGNVGNESDNSLDSQESINEPFVPQNPSSVGTSNKATPCSQILEGPSISWERKTVNEITTVPNVPTDPTLNEEQQLVAFGLSSYLRLLSIAVQDGVDISPWMDDMSARSINRLGGWEKFCELATSVGNHELQEQFMKMFRNLLPNKLSGSYDHDLLPVVKGLTGSQGVYRLKKEEIPKVSNSNKQSDFSVA